MKKEDGIQSKKRSDVLNSLKLFQVLGLLYHLYFVDPVTGLLNPPRNLSIVSENFIHILTWEPGEDAPLTTRYIVGYFSYSALHQSFNACILIMNRTCDLTDSFSDIYGNYWPRVKAVTKNDESNWTDMDHQFQPYEDTRIRPLNVELMESLVGVLNVTFDIPTLPPLIAHSLSVQSLVDIYMTLSYHITIYKDGKLEKNRDVLKMTSETQVEEIFKKMEPNTEYCFIINVYFHKEKTDPLERKCIITQYAEKDEATEASATLLVVVFFLFGAVLIVILILFKTDCLTLLGTYVPQSLKILKYTHSTYYYNDVQEKFSVMDHISIQEQKIQGIEEESDEESINIEESGYEQNTLPMTMQDSAQSSGLFSDGRTDGASAVASDDQQCDSFTKFDDCLMAPTEAMKNDCVETDLMSQLQMNHSRKSSSSSANIDTSDVPLCSVQIQDPDCCFVEFSSEQMCDQESCESTTTENIDMSGLLNSEVYESTELHHSENPGQCDIPDCSSLPQTIQSNYMRR
ncbi:interleukin-10 receptor subunit beta-like [Mobula hypostoma]|uniref:interleukin-10 receptor subunit beta-like n=1 Tax=Mobula hypostoma TaxID=723540 RepID=UPI002FC37285